MGVLGVVVVVVVCVCCCCLTKSRHLRQREGKGEVGLQIPPWLAFRPLSVADQTHGTRYVRSNRKESTNSSQESKTKCKVSQSPNNFVINCPDAEAFSRLDIHETGKRRVVIQINRVNGQLNLCPLHSLTNHSFTYLTVNITNANITGFTACSQSLDNTGVNVSSPGHLLGTGRGLLDLFMGGSGTPSITESAATLLRRMPSLLGLDVSSTGFRSPDPSLFLNNPGLGIRELDGDAFVNVVSTMQYNDGHYLFRLSITKTSQKDEKARTIWEYMGYFIIAVIGIFICWSFLPRCAYLHSRSSNRDTTKGRKFDVFVCHGHMDYELVKEVVIAPLIGHGYSVAWHDNAFKPGEWVVESVERTVRNSRRMIVVASENLVDSRWATFEIRRGLHEEKAVPGFKVVALVMDTLPKLLRRDLYDLVALRTHIVQSNSDYLMKMREFLPDPRTRKANESFSSDSLKLYFQLLERMKESKKSERVPVNKLFSIYKESSHVSINIDIADPSELTNVDLTLQRFKQRLLLDGLKHHSHTINSEYILANHGNDEDVIAQLEGFQQNLAARKSCRF